MTQSFDVRLDDRDYQIYTARRRLIGEPEVIRGLSKFQRVGKEFGISQYAAAAAWHRVRKAITDAARKAFPGEFE